MVPTRAQAWTLLTKHTQNPNLVKHALGVEAAMRGYARHFGEDEELWGVVGLIHDFDYEEHPSLEEHPFVGAAILRELGWAEEIIHAVLGHSDHTGIERTNRLDRTLYAVDELVGFIVAVALVRPSKSVVDLPVKSILKKFKDKAFCRAIDRDHLRTAADELGVDMKEHVGRIVESLNSVAPELGLQ